MLRLLGMSGTHPSWARNLGTGEGESGTKYVVAAQMLYHDPARPSRLTLPIIR
jgi:predicted acyl esterase